MLVLALLCSFAAAQIAYNPAEDAESKKTLLLKDFAPVSRLHAKQTLVTRAKFPVIDAHTHVNDAGGIGGDSTPPAELVAMMDRSNIRTMVILTGMWGEKLQKVVDAMVKPYPGRFKVLAQLDWTGIDQPGFADRAVLSLRDSAKRGAAGLKVLKDLGLGSRDKQGKLIKVDDPRLDPVWAECGRLGWPVFVHTGDPEAFFFPIDGANERYEEIVENPSWGFSDPEFPRLLSLLEARNKAFSRHPKTTFVAVHAGGWPENLDFVDKMLRDHPNVYIDIAAREAELGRQPRRARKLFLDFPDRILFGTDEDYTEKTYRNYFRWLETADEYFEYAQGQAQGRWMIYGLDLPDAVLEKVYRLNAERVLGLRR